MDIQRLNRIANLIKIAQINREREREREREKKK
jgi:hypothetical protein